MNVMIASHVSADDLRIPGMGQTLRGAGNALQDLAEQMDGIAAEIRHTKPDADDRGHSTRAVRGLARRTAEALEGDSDQMRKLSEAVGHEADLLCDAQGGMDALRQRWRQAKHHLIEVAEESQRRRRRKQEALMAEAGHGGGHGGHGRVAAGQAHLVDDTPPLDGHQLARRIESNIVSDYAHLWKRMFGWAPSTADGPPMAIAVMDDSDLDNAITNFRQEVRSVMEEWASSVRQLDDLDQAVERHLKRKPVLVAKEAHQGDGPDQSLVSGPAGLRDLGRELAEKARGIGNLVDAVSTIAPDLARGRMQPEEDRGARNNQVFEQSWGDHLRDLRQNFGPVAEEAARIAEDMLQCDQNGARAIRALIRDDD